MEYYFKFEKLLVWQKAIELADQVTGIIRKFPAEERYILSSQMQRTADSVALNIAEGSTGQTNAEYKRFLRIALRSDIEVVCCLHLAKRRKYIKEDDFFDLYMCCQQILVMINSLIKALP